MLGRVLVARFEQAVELFALNAVSRQLIPQFVAPALEAVGDVLEEQQAEDDVFILRGIDLAPEGVGRLSEHVGVAQIAGRYVGVRY